MARTAKEKQIAIAVSLLEKENHQVIPPNRCICMTHPQNKKNILSTTNFYDAMTGSVYSGSIEGKIPICKDCLKSKFIDYYSRSKNVKWSVYQMCRVCDIPFVNSIYEGASGESKTWEGTFSFYMKNFNSFGKKNLGEEVSFDNSEKVNFDFNADGEFEIKEIESKWSRQDRQSKKDTIDMIGYEVYDGYGELDQKFLYNDIIHYLDEETLEDQYKVSVIITIVDNNNQIRKLRYVKNQYSSDMNMILEHADKLNTIENMIKKLVETNDKLSKENGISVKNRKDKSLNKSTLTGKIKYLAEQNFDEMEVDFYSQKVCYGMERAEQISLKAIKDQFQWDENDQNEVLVVQRELIEQQNKKILNLEEDVRQLHTELAGGSDSIKDLSDT